MNLKTPLHTDHQLDQLAGQFAQWRQHRSHPSERIPQDLWEQAAALAMILPYSYVAKHLRLSPSDLKKQMMAQQGPTFRAPAPALSFIEVPPAPEHPMTRPGTEIELQRADGARLRLRSGESTLPLAAVGSCAWWLRTNTTRPAPAPLQGVQQPVMSPLSRIPEPAPTFFTCQRAYLPRLACSSSL